MSIRRTLPPGPGFTLSENQCCRTSPSPRRAFEAGLQIEDADLGASHPGGMSTAVIDCRSRVNQRGGVEALRDAVHFLPSSGSALRTVFSFSTRAALCNVLSISSSPLSACGGFIRPSPTTAEAQSPVEPVGGVVVEIVGLFKAGREDERQSARTAAERPARPVRLTIEHPLARFMPLMSAARQRIPADQPNRRRPWP